VQTQKSTTMGKDNKKHLVGQPIYRQIVNLIPSEVINLEVFKHQSDFNCRSFSTWDELVTLLFGIFERCDSAREVCDGMATLGGNLNYPGMDCSPAKSTFNDALIRRSEKVFESIYFALLAYFFSDFIGQPKRGH
jgi:hypothetical protein